MLPRTFLLQILHDQLKKLTYARSYFKAGRDVETMAIAEEGMDTYHQDLKENLKK